MGFSVLMSVYKKEKPEYSEWGDSRGGRNKNDRGISINNYSYAQFG